MNGERKRVAIVGGGIAGIGAALELQDTCDVVLYEAAPVLGGHILPVAATDAQGQPNFVDTGFVVFVPKTYPSFTLLLAKLKVDHAAARTRFRITDDVRGLSFEPGDLLKLAGREIPRACRRDLMHLHRTLQRVRRDGTAWLGNPALGEWLHNNDYAPESVELGVLPWIASFWGLQPEHVLEVAATVALREISRNAGPYAMHRVVPSTKVYLDRLVAALAPTTVRHEKVERIETSPQPVVITQGGSETFDHVVPAVAADDALRMLPDVSKEVRGVLAEFTYETTVAVVHADSRLLPAEQAKWRTFHHRRRTDTDRVRSATTWVLDLLHEWHEDPEQIERPTLLTTGDPGLVDEGIIDPDATQVVFRHRHLLMTPRVVDAVDALHKVDTSDAFTLAGSYTSVGALHEDALISGQRAAVKVRASLGIGAKTD